MLIKKEILKGLFLVMLATLVIQSKPRLIYASSEPVEWFDYTGVLPASTYIQNVSGYLDISNDKALIYAEGAVYSGRYLTLVSTLQRYTSSGWINVNTFSKTGYGSAAINTSHSLSIRGNYRLRTVITCSGETITKYTKSVKY